jgi:hypothetical protein
MLQGMRLILICTLLQFVVSQIAWSQTNPKYAPKKKRRSVSTSESSSKAEPGSIHRAQEGSFDELYTWELGLVSDLSRTTTKTKAGDNEEEGGFASYDFSLKALRFFGRSFALGLGGNYSEITEKTEDETNTNRSYVVGPVVKYYVGDINEDVGLAFIKGEFAMGGSLHKKGDVETKTSLMQFGGGLGYAYFIDTNVSLSAEAGVVMGTEKSEEDLEISFQRIHFLTIGISLFL